MKKKGKDKKVTVEDLIATVREINRVAMMIADLVKGRNNERSIC